MNFFCCCYWLVGSQHVTRMTVVVVLQLQLLKLIFKKKKTLKTQCLEFQ